MAVAATVPHVRQMHALPIAGKRMHPRGSRRRFDLEMTAAMLVPGLASIVLLQAGLVENIDTLFAIEHSAMFVAMFALMLARRAEYSGASATCRPVAS